MKKNPLSDFVRALGATLLLIVAILIPLAGPFLFLATALPALLLTYSRGPVLGSLLAAAVGLMLLGVQGWQTGLAVSLFILSGGVLTASLIRLGWPARLLIPVSTVATSLSLVITGLLMWLTSGFNLWVQAVRVIRDAIKMTQAAMLKSVDAETAKAIGKVFKEASTAAPSLLPGLAILLFLIGAAITVLAALIILRKRGQSDVPAVAPFTHWQVPWYWSWAMVGAIGATLMPRIITVPQQAEVILTGAGISLWIMFGPIYFIQGIAVLMFLLKRWKAPVILTAFLTAMILLVPVAGQMALMTGLLDTWFDLRKLEAETGKDDDEARDFPVSS